MFPYEGNSRQEEATVTETRTCRRQSRHVIVTCRMNRMFYPQERGTAFFECVSYRGSLGEPREDPLAVRSFMRSIFPRILTEYEVER